MSGTQMQAGSPDTDFLKGLELIIDSLVEKNSSGMDGDALEKIGPLAAAGLGALASGALEGDGEEKQASHVEDATDLGEKTNLPPEMGKREEGSSIAEPMLRRREVRKADLNSMQRGIDLFKMLSTVDKTIEKVDGPRDCISDLQILKAFELCECTKTEDLIDGTLIYKMLTDRGSRPSVEWWEGCIDFAKSFEDMEEPAFFATFLYHKPDKFRPDSFMKGLNDTGGTPRGSGHGVSHDTEIDENIGAAGGQAIDGLGMSDDGMDDETDDHYHKT